MALVVNRNPPAPCYISHIICGEHLPNFAVLGMTECEAAGAGVEGTPRGRSSACESRRVMTIVSLRLSTGIRFPDLSRTSAQVRGGGGKKSNQDTEG